MKDAYYFSHDANARNDEKILMLRAEHGMVGYGIYWALIESMFENEDTKLRHDKVKGLALVFNIDITLLSSVINTCITEKLFISDDVHFWSESLMRRKNKYQNMKKSKSDAGKKGMEKRWGNVENSEFDNTVITENESVITEHNKGKERKGKERKDISEKYSQGFMSVWDEYPRKENKAGSFSKYKNLIKIHGDEKVKGVIGKYVKEVKIKNIDLQYVKKLNNFLNDSFDDYLENQGQTKEPITKKLELKPFDPSQWQ